MIFNDKYLLIESEKNQIFLEYVINFLRLKNNIKVGYKIRENYLCPHCKGYLNIGG